MAFLRNIAPETLSFWLGFLAASVFWWLISRIRPLVPRIRQWIRQQIKNSQRKGFDRVDEYFRREALRRAQRNHLAAPLFALDEILVPPRLLAPPPAFSNPANPAPDTIVSQVIAYLPDWPEWSAQYPVPSLSLAEALQGDANLVIIGQPGCGKSVALAALASQAARRESHASEARTPIYLHVLDLLPDSNAADPLDRLIGSMAAQAPITIQSQLTRFFRRAAGEERLLLLLDGIDELPPAQVDQTCQFLTALTQKYPVLRVVTTGNPGYLDGFARAGFAILPLAAWSGQDARRFVQTWRAAWEREIRPLTEKAQAGQSPVDPRLLTGWMETDGQYDTPLEWTLRIWALFAGDVRGPTNRDALTAYLRRFVRLQPVEKSLSALSALAAELLIQSRAAMGFEEMEKFLSRLRIESLEIQIAGEAAGKPTPKPGRNARKITAAGNFLIDLLDAGILVEQNGEQIHFAHPSIAGLLAAGHDFSKSRAVLSEPARWSLRMSACRYLAGEQPELAGLPGLLQSSDPLLRPGLLTAARWIKDAPANCNWRGEALRQLVMIAQDEHRPASLRARCLCALAVSQDASLVAVLKQLLGSRDASTRQLAALAAGAVQSPRLVDGLMSALADSDLCVRYCACLALAAIDEPRAKQAVPGALLNGDEGTQQAAAEALSGSPEGIEILQEAAGMDNLMLRRAAVLGISRIREEWARALIEKIAVEDGQWMVRSAAVQAMEAYQRPSAYLPAHLPPPSNAGWLIAYAGKIGVGIPPYQYPQEMLLRALQDGTAEEKLGALTYLRSQPDPQTTRAIRQTVEDETSPVREAAAYALWVIAASGLS